MWNVRGHSLPRQWLRAALSRDRLGQAYLFVGPKGIGKRRFAECFAQALFCERTPPAALDPCGACPGCQQLLAKSHCDLITVERPLDSASIPIDLLIGSSANRGREGFCYELSRRPMAGGRRVAILDDAEFLEEAGANAVLKTLEEPPAGAVIIVIAPSVSVLLPTIRSRCQAVPFAPLGEADVAELLVAHELAEDAEAARMAAALAGGSVETARQLLDPALREQRELLFNSLAKQPFAPAELSKQLIAGIEKAGSAAAAKRRHAGWLIRFAIDFFRQTLRALSGATALDNPAIARFSKRFPQAAPADLDLLGELIDRCLLADQQIDQNLHMATCIQGWLEDVSRELRKHASAGRL